MGEAIKSLVSQIKVLIADDSAFLRKTISDILMKHESIEIVDHATNGIEAIKMVKRYSPDVLVLDLIMPKMNGLDAFKHIMKDNPTPTVILSAISPKNLGASVQALLMGACDYVIKPGGLGAKNLPEFRDQLLEKVLTAAKSQIKKIYGSEREKESIGKVSLRQGAVSDIFKFGKYLNKLIPYEEIDETKEKEQIKREKTEERPIEREIVSKKIIQKDLTVERKKIKILSEHEELNKSGSIKIKKKKIIDEPIKEKSLEKIKEEPLKTVKTQIKPLKTVKTPVVIKKKIDYVPDLTPVKNVSISNNVIVIGASVGGPRTIRAILKDLPQNLSCPILIVQHLTEHFVETFTKTLDHTCNIRIKVAENKEFIKPGIVYIAPGNRHMEISVLNRKPCIKIYSGPAVHFCIPSIDVLFFSAAKVYRKRAMGILLTGMGEDGVEGLGSIQKFGGKTIAESEETSVLYGMPKFAAKRGYAKQILPNYKIKDHIIKFSK